MKKNLFILLAIILAVPVFGQEIEAEAQSRESMAMTQTVVEFQLASEIPFIETN